MRGGTEAGPGTGAPRRAPAAPPRPPPPDPAGLRERQLAFRLVPLLGRLARGADPCAEEGDALGIAPERPRHQLLCAAARARLGRLARLHLVREPRDLGLHARDYTLSSAPCRPPTWSSSSPT